MQRKPRQFAHTTPVTLAVALAAGCASAFAADPGAQYPALEKPCQQPSLRADGLVLSQLLASRQKDGPPRLEWRL